MNKQARFIIAAKKVPGFRFFQEPSQDAAFSVWICMGLHQTIPISCALQPHRVDKISLHHTIIRAAFVRLFVPLLLRGPLTDLHQTWWVYVGGPRNCP